MTVEGYDPNMFLLSVASYVGTDVKFPGGDQAVHDAIVEQLKKWRLAEWRIVWGPGIAALPSVLTGQAGEFPSDIMFVARNGSSYFISVSPTNFRSAFDVTEDFRVRAMRRWPYAPQDDDDDAVPKISEGFHEALNILQLMRPAEGLPGHGRTLDQFLHEEVRLSRDVQIITGGHSQGGATAPLVALWLLDTKNSWDRMRHVPESAFSCYRSAGPTPGEKVFADYYDSRLPNTVSLVNKLDFVTKMFVQSEMETIPEMYDGLPAPPAVKILAGAMIRMADDHAYTQIAQGEKQLFTFNDGAKPNMSIYAGGGHLSECERFTWQMGYQHVQAYFDALGLGGSLSYEQFAGICRR